MFEKYPKTTLCPLYKECKHFPTKVQALFPKSASTFIKECKHYIQ